VTVAVEEEEGNDPNLVGYVFVLPERLAMIWDAAVINELYVVPESRGTGVADELMGAAVALAGDQDLPLDRIVLDVDPRTSGPSGSTTVTASSSGARWWRVRSTAESSKPPIGARIF